GPLEQPVRQLDGDRAGADQGHRLLGLQRLHVEAAVLKGPGVVDLGLLRRIPRAGSHGGELQPHLVYLFHPLLRSPPAPLRPPPPSPDPPGPARRPPPPRPAATPPATPPTLPGPGRPPRPSAPAARPAPVASSRPRP